MQTTPPLEWMRIWSENHKSLDGDWSPVNLGKLYDHVFDLYKQGFSAEETARVTSIEFPAKALPKDNQQAG